MADDLSRDPVDALVPSAQNSADSRPHLNNAMAPPGGEPADGMAESPVPAPHIAAERFEPLNLVDGGEPDAGASWDNVSGRREAWRP